MPSLINLQLGWPSPSLFPAAQLLGGAGTVLNSSSKTSAALIYGPDAGYLPLREEIAAWLTSIYRPNSEPTAADRICITNGASANLDNILAKFTEPGYTRRVWMVEPSYFLACPIFTDAGFGGRLRGVPEDEEGLDLEFLRRALEETERGAHPETATKGGARYPKVYKHVIYAVPTFANPSGKTMSLRRREGLVRLAREFDALVVTDDVYDVLRWPASEGGKVADLGAAPPRIVDVDRALDAGPKDEYGHAVSNGSFSKIVAPGVRTGWAEGTPSFSLALSTVGATRSGGCPSHLTATFVHEMLATGQLQGLIRDILIPTYGRRYHAMFRAIEEHLIPLGYEVSAGRAYEETSGGGGERAAGGYFTYLTVPADLGVSTRDLAARALEKHNLKFAFGAMMAVEGDEGSTERGAEGYGNGIRLCWAWHVDEEIREGIERLAALTREVQSQQ